MNKSPAYQWYVREWLSSPTRLMMSKAARSAYRDLLDYLWDSEDCRLTNDEEILRKLCDCDEQEWKDFGAKILENFIPFGEGFITNKKMRKQWRALKAFKINASERGKVGAQRRWHGHGSAINQPIAKNGSASAFASASASALKDLKPRPQKARPVLPTCGKRENTTKTITPQRERYGQVSRLITGAMLIIAKAKGMGSTVEPGELKEQLKEWAAQNGFEYDADSISKAMDVAEEKAKT